MRKEWIVRLGAASSACGVAEMWRERAGRREGLGAVGPLLLRECRKRPTESHIVSISRTHDTAFAPLEANAKEGQGRRLEWGWRVWSAHRQEAEAYCPNELRYGYRRA